MQSDLRILIEAILFCLVVITVLMYVVVAPVTYIECSMYGRNTEREVKYHYLANTCYVKHRDQYYERSELKTVIIANGLKEK